MASLLASNRESKETTRKLQRCEACLRASGMCERHACGACARERHSVRPYQCVTCVIAGGRTHACVRAWATEWMATPVNSFPSLNHRSVDFDFPGSEVESGHSYTYNYQSMMNVRRVLMVDDSLVTLKTQVTYMHACVRQSRPGIWHNLSHAFIELCVVGCHLPSSVVSVCLSSFESGACYAARSGGVRGAQVVRPDYDRHGD